jgi:hypothetical protein
MINSNEVIKSDKKIKYKSRKKHDYIKKLDDDIFTYSIAKVLATEMGSGPHLHDQNFCYILCIGYPKIIGPPHIFIQ